LAFFRLEEIAINHVSGYYHGVDSFVIKRRRRDHERDGAQGKTAGDLSEATVDASHV